MEKTKRKLLLFYHYRKEYPFYYKGFSYDDPKIKRVLDRGAFTPLPAYDALGRRILVSWLYYKSNLTFAKKYFHEKSVYRKI